jgi:hypothetical protein
MDAERFDGLVRTFGQTRSRRQTLRGLVGAAIGALALGGRDVSADECKRNGKACKKNSQCCSGNCVGGTGGKANDGTCQQPDGAPCTTRCDTTTQDCLANGTCVTRCAIPADCGASCVTCTGGVYCRGPVAGSLCSSLSDCPPGQFCRREDSVCVFACTPS